MVEHVLLGNAIYIEGEDLWYLAVRTLRWF